jgi:N-acetylglucosamine kinase-like BadF-type ATPase
LADLLVDVGQTGLRATWSRGLEDATRTLPAPGEHLTAPGAPARLVERIAEVRRLLPVDTVGRALVGTTGFDATVARAMAPELIERLACRTVVIADDAVTAYLGALGPRAGTTLVAGTGVVALASGSDGAWHRAGGWGWAIDDEGGGFWLGLAGLRLAARAVDRGGACALLVAAVSRFGPPQGWPRRLYGGDTVASVASFAVDVVSVAEAGDAEAQGLCRDAAAALVRTARAAAAPTGSPDVLAVTGGLVPPGRLLDRLLDGALDAMAWRPERIRPLGGPLDGVAMLGRPDARARFDGLFVEVAAT